MLQTPHGQSDAALSVGLLTSLGSPVPIWDSAVAPFHFWAMILTLWPPCFSSSLALRVMAEDKAFGSRVDTD